MNTMRLAAAALLAVLTSPAGHAAVFGTVPLQDGGRIDLHDARGPCAGEARLAEYVPLRGELVTGCWVQGGGYVVVVFFDADIARFPASVVQAVRTL
jgi:hypothetical protein